MVTAMSLRVAEPKGLDYSISMLTLILGLYSINPNFSNSSARLYSLNLKEEKWK